MSAGLYVDWQGAADVLYGAASLAAGLAKSAAMPLVNLVKGGIDAVSMLASVNNDIRQLNHEKEQLLIHHYQHSEASKAEFIQNLLKTLDKDTFPVSMDSLNAQLQKQTSDQQIDSLRQAIEIGQRFRQFEKIYQQALDLSAFLDVDLTPFHDFYQNYVNGIFQNAPVSDVHQALEEIYKNLKTFLVEQKETIRQAMLDQKFEEFFFDLNHTIDSPILAVLNTHYAQLLNAKDLDESAFEKKKQILGFKEALIQTMTQIEGLQFLGDDYAQAKRLFESGVEFFSREDLSENDRYDFVQIRAKMLAHYRISMQEKYRELLHVKDLFDQQYRIYRFLTDSLGLQPLEFTLDANTLPEAVKTLDMQIKRLEPEYQRNQALLAIRHKIRKALIQRNRRPLAQTTQMTSNGKTYQDIYEAGEGNVLVVNINEKGLVNYQVKGVKIPGLPNDPAHIRTSMHHSCPLMESTLNELLPSEGKAVTKFYGEHETSIALIDLDELPPQAQHMMMEQRSGSEASKGLLSRALVN